MTNAEKEDQQMPDVHSDDLARQVEREQRNTAQKAYEEQALHSNRLQQPPSQQKQLVLNVAQLKELTPSQEDLKTYLEGQDNNNPYIEEVGEEIIFDTQTMKYKFKPFREKNYIKKMKKNIIKNPIENVVANFLSWEKEQSELALIGVDRETNSIEEPCFKMNTYKDEKKEERLPPTKFTPSNESWKQGN